MVGGIEAQLTATERDGDAGVVWVFFRSPRVIAGSLECGATRPPFLWTPHASVYTICVPEFAWALKQREEYFLLQDRNKKCRVNITVEK
jgi:hypothetical protein